MTGARGYAIPMLIGALVAFLALPLMARFGTALVLGIEAAIAVALVAGVWWWGKREAG